MVKVHNKSRSDLLLMNVTMLKDMVRKHNLDNSIKRYSSMRKADLVDALMKHSTKPNLVIVKEVKPVPKKAAAAKKKAAPKKKEDDDEDDYFANIGKGKGAIKKVKLSAAHEASKKVLKAKREAAKKAAAEKKPAAKKKPYESYFLTRFRDIVGDFLKLKETLLARKRKVASGQKAAIDEQVKRLDKFIKMDKFPGPRAKASTLANRFMKLPTSEELGFAGSETMIGKTKTAVTAFIKAREVLTDYIPLIEEGIKRHEKEPAEEPAEVVPKKKTPAARAAPKTEAVSAASYRSGFGFGSTSDRLSSMGISPLFAGLFK